MAALKVPVWGRGFDPSGRVGDPLHPTPNQTFSAASYGCGADILVPAAAKKHEIISRYTVVLNPSLPLRLAGSFGNFCLCDPLDTLTEK